LTQRHMTKHGEPFFVKDGLYLLWKIKSSYCLASC